eukprot:8386089-Alexandrium_andersonii.AAC.1
MELRLPSRFQPTDCSGAVGVSALGTCASSSSSHPSLVIHLDAHAWSHGKANLGRGNVAERALYLSLIHISEPTRLALI